MRSTLVLLSAVALTAVLIPALPSHAEKAPESAENLLKRSTHIVTGKVQAIYTRQEKTPEWIYTRYVAEILVSSVGKGESSKVGSVTYARYWTRSFRGSVPPPSVSGHYPLPKQGDTVQAFLVQGKNDGYGNKTTDGGLDAIGPNGFKVLKRAKK